MNKVKTIPPASQNSQSCPSCRPVSREDFVQFARGLAEQFRLRPEEWENRDPASYLEAMAAWVEDMDGYYQNRGETVPSQPTWNTLRDILEAAKVYE
jgi:hypothetical protein